MIAQSSSTPRIALEVPGDLITRIDQFAADRAFPSRSAAVRTLIHAGLQAMPGPHQDPRAGEMLANRLQPRNAA